MKRALAFCILAVALVPLGCVHNRPGATSASNRAVYTTHSTNTTYRHHHHHGGSSGGSSHHHGDGGGSHHHHHGR